MNFKNKNTSEGSFNKAIATRTDKMVDTFFSNIENLEKPTTEESAQIYSSILKEIKQPFLTAPIAKENISKSNILYLYKRAIAVVFICIVSASLFLIWLGASDQTIKTAFAENKEIILPDGSKVVLNSNSSLKYSKEWDDNQDRKVWLEGEGYFSVVKGITNGQKFEVIAKGLSVIVTGTSFNVSSRKDKVEVFLEEGKISLVTEANKNIIKQLKPGDFVRYHAKSNEMKISQNQEEIKHVSSWKDGNILFQGSSLMEILEKFNEIYGVEFEVEDKKVLNRKITVGIPGEQLDVAITILENVLGMEIIKNGESQYSIQ
jgi:ferric-dicitrate binding protein FerR (iron transport regulator)